MEKTSLINNTFFLYLRSFVSIAVNLYSVRLLWHALGIENYGIWNVVCGLAVMFGFLNNAMVASSQRFLSFELGRGDLESLRKTFSCSISVHILLSVIILILAESFGVWLLNAELNIPSDRMIAANWAYQCSVVTFITGVMSVPYNACIVAHEHMRVFGYVGIIEVISKLVIVLLTSITPFDKLIVYSVLLLCLSIIMRVFYAIYCKKNFDECRYSEERDVGLIKSMFGFAGWSFLGNLGFALRNQGNTFLINVFFNVAVNAAMSVAAQISGVINGFASNFTMAINPRITKSYAKGDLTETRKLLFMGCKFSFILMSVVVAPIFVAADAILSLWLDNVAPYTVGFIRLMLAMSLIDCVVSPVTTALQATGKIRMFQIVICVIMASSILISWIGLIYFDNPYIVMIMSIFSALAALLARLMILHNMIEFSYKRFIIDVYSRTIPCLALILVSAMLIHSFFSKNVIGLLGYGVAVGIAELIIIIFFALTNEERNYLVILLKKHFKLIAD
ncbi:MAG: MATE family efflux transporter [Muribaculum sp.]|nr:MATE family efflux transporter [Muribaculum sp.]